MMTYVILSMKLNLWKLEQWLDKDWKKYEQKYLANSLVRDEIQARILKFFHFFRSKFDRYFNGESLSVWVPLRSIVGMNEYQLGSQGLFIGYKNLMLPILQQVITLFWDLFKDIDDLKDPIFDNLGHFWVIKGHTKFLGWKFVKVKRPCKLLSWLQMVVNKEIHSITKPKKRKRIWIHYPKT